MGRRVRTRRLPTLALVALLGVAACTPGTPTSSGSPKPASTTTQPTSGSSTFPPSSASPALALGAWKRLPPQPVFKQARVFDVIEGGPGYVAVGCEERSREPEQDSSCAPAVWTSKDGLEWARSANVPPARNAAIMAVAIGGPGLIATGYAADKPDQRDISVYRAAFWTSRDGIAWSRVADSSALKDAQASEVVRFQGRFIAAGTSVQGYEGGPALVWSSTDGLAWTREDTRELGEFTGGALGVFRDQLILSGGPSNYCGPGCRRHVWTSSDGSQWARVPDSPAFDGAVTFRPALEVEGRMLATGSVGPIVTDEGTPFESTASLWESADGLTWARVTIPAPKRSEIGHIVSFGPSLIAVGTIRAATGDVSQGITWTSLDGRAWKLEPMDPGLRRAAIDHVLVTDRGVVAFGSDRPEPGAGTALWFRPFAGGN